MEFTFNVFEKTRGIFKTYLETLTLEQLNKIPEGFNNNIIWNIGHSIITEQILVYKLSGLPLNVSENLVKKYVKGSFPDGNATQKDVEELNSLTFSTIKQTKEDYKNTLFKTFTEYTLSTTGNTLTKVEEAIDFALFHEGIHQGYILALLRVLKN